MIEILLYWQFPHEHLVNVQYVCGVCYIIVKVNIESLPCCLSFKSCEDKIVDVIIGIAWVDLYLYSDFNSNHLSHKEFNVQFISNLQASLYLFPCSLPVC